MGINFGQPVAQHAAWYPSRRPTLSPFGVSGLSERARDVAPFAAAVVRRSFIGSHTDCGPGS